MKLIARCLQRDWKWGSLSSASGNCIGKVSHKLVCQLKINFSVVDAELPATLAAGNSSVISQINCYVALS